MMLESGVVVYVALPLEYPQCSRRSSAPVDRICTELLERATPNQVGEIRDYQDKRPIWSDQQTRRGYKYWLVMDSLVTNKEYIPLRYIRQIETRFCVANMMHNSSANGGDINMHNPSVSYIRPYIERPALAQA